MRNKGELSISIKGWALGFLLFSLIPAFYVWNNSLDTLFTFAISVIVFFDSIQQKERVDYYRKIGIFLYIFIFLIFIFRSDFTILGIIKKLFVIPILFARKELLKDTYSAFVWVYAGVISISLIVYFAVIFVGIGLPSRVIEPLNDLKNYTYYLYPFLITSDSIDTLGLSFRFCGLFDEPGVVGTFSAIILIINRFDFSKVYNIIIFVAGIFSFSLFFYVICVAAVLLSAPGKVKIVTILFIGVLLFVFKDNEVVDQLIFSRFSGDDDGVLGMVDNRNTGLFNSYYERFSKTGAYWFGLGAGSAAKIGDGGSSYKMLVYDYGMLFFVPYIFVYYFFVFGNFRGWKSFVAFSLILLGTMYQRPFVGEITYTFLILSSSYLIAENYENKKTRKDIIKRNCLSETTC